jgi:uncharacterized LabA/DUF88 family protein
MQPMNADSNNLRLAVLIDADNTFRVIDIIDELFEEISKFGNASVRRIYGDWTDRNLGRWKEVLPKHAIQPIQQFANTKGKNATDSALIIDAMDLLYSAPLDGFCIVSSDSDFTRLAVRFRESGKFVFGFGEEKTPESLRAACDRFIFIEILSQNKEVESAASAETETHSATSSPADVVSPSEPELVKAAEPETHKLIQPGTRKTTKELAQDAKLVSLIRSAIDALSDEDGFAHIGEVKKHIVKNYSAFDSRNYGYAKFSDLVKTVGLFEIDPQKQRIKDKRKK